MTSENEISRSENLNKQLTQPDENGERGDIVRIRAVHEINSTVGNNDQPTSDGIKRKLPAWLTSPVGDSNKKTKLKNESETNEVAIKVEPQDDSATENPHNNSQSSVNNPIASTSKGNETNEVVVKIEPQDDSTVENARNNSQSDINNPIASTSNAEVGSSSDINDGRFEASGENENVDDKSKHAADTDMNSEAEAAVVKIKQEIKDEPHEDEDIGTTEGSSTTNDQKPVIKEEATSTIRDSCKYGIRCYR